MSVLRVRFNNKYIYNVDSKIYICSLSDTGLSDALGQMQCRQQGIYLLSF